MARAVALSLAVLLAVFEIGTCLQCYQCTSTQDKTNCGEKTTSAIKPVDCSAAQAFTSYLPQAIRSYLPNSGNINYCLKVNDLTGSFVRTCIAANNAAELKNACDTIKSTNLVKSCEYCDKDYCNASNAVSSSLPIAFLALVATYLFYKQ